MSEIDRIVEKCVGDELVPCQAICPLSVDIKGYINLIKQGNLEEALRLVYKSLPFPGIVGRICTRPCEAKCRREEIGGSIQIAGLKRFIADNVASAEGVLAPLKDRREKVAIIGAGPAGLMAAYDLRRLGYQVTVFEALPFVGGMMRVGIPEWRLPRDILEQELGIVERMGAEIRFNTPVGEKITLDDLGRDFQAVFIAVGAHLSSPLGIPGEDSRGVFQGMDFLRAVNLGQKIEVGDRAIIVGGGNTAFDAARAALRLGATQVWIVYRRSKAEVPAIDNEVREAEREGINIHYLTNPVRIKGEDSKDKEVECLRMELGELDDSGRKRPVPIPNSEFLMEADMIISAIGQFPDLSCIAGSDLKLRNGAFLQANPLTLETNIKGVFAGGDAVTGPSTVIDALAAGRKAAISIDRYLRRKDMILDRDEGSRESKLVVDINGIPPKQRIPMLVLPPIRRNNFQEVELGFSRKAAIQEAERCLQCECKLCIKNCEFLKSVCETPRQLAKGFRNGYFRERPDIPYSCNLCGLCKRLCPEDLDIGQMCLDLRRQLVGEELGPLPRHLGVISDQEWAASDSFSLSLYDSNLGESKRFFFPGCNLSAYSPDLVTKTYAYLQSKLPGTGIILGCCGAPSHDIGDQPRFQDMLGKVTSEMEKARASELIVACTHCYHTFKDNAPYIQLRSVYEVMAELGLPEEVRAQNDKAFAIHDPCKTRYESKIQDSVRAIVKELGYKVEEIEFSKDKTRCCGMGGMAAYVDLMLVKRIITLRANEMPNDVLSYCASCRDAFALVKKPSLHILDLVFNPEWEEAAKRPPALAGSRRKNQSRLRERLIEESDKTPSLAGQEGD